MERTVKTYVQTEGLWLDSSLATSMDSTVLVVPTSYNTQQLHILGSSVSCFSSFNALRSSRPGALQTGSCVEEVCTPNYIQVGCHKR